jgi:hypothetical protein
MNKLTFQTTAAAAVLVMTVPCFAQSDNGTDKSAGKKFSAGLEIRTSVTAADAGLPAYPGATLVRDENDKSNSVKLGLWAGDFGVKLVVAKLESTDSPDKIAVFYQKALSQYGTVLDCSKPGREKTERSDDNGPLTCERDRAEKDGYIFKAGTKRKQHIAAIQPRENGAEIQLIYVEKRGTK